MRIDDERFDGGTRIDMESLTDEPEIDLVVDEDTGDFTMLTGEELREHRGGLWFDDERDEQFWDRRMDA